MTAPSLLSDPGLLQLAQAFKSLDQLSARFSGIAKGPARATVVDVDDPEERGRVRVVFDAHNPEDIAEYEGAGVFSEEREGERQVSHWLDTSPAFKGKQPPGLKGKRVHVNLSNGQHPYAILQDVLFDPQILTDSAAEKLRIPNNSTMVRLPIYPAGQLPMPVKENLGCMAIEEGGPMNSDWVCVCLKRDGKYIWVRHGDLAHGHAGGNDITSQVDSAGNRPGNGQVGAIWDCTFVTSQQESEKFSVYGSNFRGNPLGENALWHPPPNGVDGDGNPIERLPIKPAELFDQATALKFARESGFIGFQIPGNFASAFSPEIPAAVSSLPGYNVAKSLLDKGEKVLKIAEAARKIIANPNLVKDVALAAATDYVTDATKAAILGGNSKNLITTVYSSLTRALLG